LMAVPHITVCVCTFRRPLLLGRLLDGLARQDTDGRFGYSVVVADNDATESARAGVEAAAAAFPVPLVYCVEPEQNFALVRNQALRQVNGEFFAFIDDDEAPVSDWLRRLWETCETFHADGVLGPVLPRFDETPPTWLRRGGFYDRPRHPTGHRLDWPECRTGNVLARTRILAGLDGPFRAEFGTGGEDQDFFRRAVERGGVFVWCDEAVASEAVPPSRWTRRFLLTRALLRGRNTLRHPRHRLRNLAKSLVAVPLYLLALPFLLLAGQHWFMRYAVKLADHAGRLLAAVHLNPVRTRPI